MGKERGFQAQGRWLCSCRCHPPGSNGAPEKGELDGYLCVRSPFPCAAISVSCCLFSTGELCSCWRLSGRHSLLRTYQSHVRGMVRQKDICILFPTISGGGHLVERKEVLHSHRRLILKSGCTGLQVWTDFVDCFVDSVLAKGQTVPARYSPQVISCPVAAPGRINEHLDGAVGLTNRDTVQEEVRPTFLPAVPRLVAIGDLHGDMQKARRAFRLGGLVDASDRWAGGTTTAVQVLLHYSLCVLEAHSVRTTHEAQDCWH